MLELTTAIRGKSQMREEAAVRIKFAILVSSILGAVMIALAGTSPAQAATLSPAAAGGTHATAIPAYTADVTATVRCGKFVGKIYHGGTGGLLNRAYLQVVGTLTGSCDGATTKLEVRYTTGVESFDGTQIASVRGRASKDVDWQTHSIEGTFGNIGVRVGTTDGMPSGETHWGAWKNV